MQGGRPDPPPQSGPSAEDSWYRLVVKPLETLRNQENDVVLQTREVFLRTKNHGQITPIIQKSSCELRLVQHI